MAGSVKVLLKKNVESLGSGGEVVRVKPGFARNYLLPRGFAIAATAGNLARYDRIRVGPRQQSTGRRPDSRHRLCAGRTRQAPAPPLGCGATRQPAGQHRRCRRVAPAAAQAGSTATSRCRGARRRCALGPVHRVGSVRREPPRSWPHRSRRPQRSTGTSPSSTPPAMPTEVA